MSRVAVHKWWAAADVTAFDSAGFAYLGQLGPDAAVLASSPILSKDLVKHVQ